MSKRIRAVDARSGEQAEGEQLDAAVRTKVIEVADLLRSQAPEAPLSQEYLDSLVRQQTPGAGALFCAAVRGALPEIEPSETGGAYGDRVLAGVRR